MNSLKQSIIKSIIGLGLFAIVTSGLIATTQVFTKETIEKQIKKAQSKALAQIVSLEEHDNDLLSDPVALDAGGLLNLPQGKQAYIARMNNSPIAVILPVVAANGYSGPINMIVGIDPLGNVKGVRVIGHKETPGLGDKIDIKKSDWISQFEGTSLNNPKSTQWKVKKDGGDFDQLTGATITPRAVVSGVQDALLFFQKNKQSLFKPTNNAVPINTVPIKGETNGH